MQAFSSIFKGLGRLFLQPIFLILLLIVVSGAGIYLFTRYQTISQQLSQLKNDPNAEEKKELEDLVAKVGQLTELPQGEQPTIATVTDAETLKGQSFFQNAQNGDRVLIYAEARRAILYRPSTGKIIEVAPINIGEAEGLNQSTEATSGAQVEGATTQEATGPVKLALSNGTTVAGLTVTASDDLEEKLTDLEINVVSRTDADGEYEATLVVVLNPSFDAAANSIANVLGGSVGDLPEGETKPDADILVILGSDYAQ